MGIEGMENLTGGEEVKNCPNDGRVLRTTEGKEVCPACGYIENPSGPIPPHTEDA